MGQYLVFRDRPPMHYHSPTSPPHLCCRKRIGCKSGLPFPFFSFSSFYSLPSPNFPFLFLSSTSLYPPSFLPSFLLEVFFISFLPSFFSFFYVLIVRCSLPLPAPLPPFSPSDEEQTCRYSGKVVGGRGKVRGEGGESSSKKG